MADTGPPVQEGMGDVGSFPGSLPTPSPFNNHSFVENGLGDMAARATFLALFLIFGFVGNCVLLATLAQGHRLKGSALNIFMINLSLANILDCLMNIPLILGATITEKWDYGDLVCRINSFGVNLISITVILGLMLMAVDRTVAVKNNARYSDLLSNCKSSTLIILMWVESLAFSVPLVANLVDSKPFAARYLCSIASGASLIYIVLMSFFCYVLPLLTIMVCYGVIIHASVREKSKQKQLLFSHQESMDEGLNHSRVFIEVNTSKYVGVLCVCWCIVQGPYLLLNFIEQVRNSAEFKDSGGSLDFTYPWQVDLSFTWIKLSFPIFLPIITFCWQKEVWQKFKNWILCRKSNLIKDSSPHDSPSHSRAGLPQLESNGVQDSSPFSIPVLYATSNGLHFQTYGKQQKEEYSDTETCVGNDTMVTTDEPAVMATKCDVYGSQDYLQLDHDTSDYDSQGEIDPYSNSNPISVRTEYQRQQSAISLTGAKVTTKTQQNSETASRRESVDVAACDDHEDGGRDETDRHYSFDSGISSTNNTQEKRRRKSKNTDRIDSVQEELPPAAVKDDDAENDISTKSDRTSSNDSGRGSEGGSGSTERRKAKRRPKLQQETPATDENSKNTDDTVSDDKHQKRQPEQLAEATNNDSLERKKSKKKKKKKREKDKEKPRKEDKETTTEVIEMKPAESPLPKASNHGSKEDSASMVVRPPARLKPLEHRQESAPQTPQPMPRPSKLPNLTSQESFELSKPPTNSKSSSKNASSPGSKVPEVSITLDPAATAQNKEDGALADPDSCKLTPDGKRRPKPTPRRSVSQPEPPSKSNSPEGPLHNTPMHHRQHSNTDSQTALLNSSATSTDLSEAKEVIFHPPTHHRKKRRKEAAAAKLVHSTSVQ